MPCSSNTLINGNLNVAWVWKELQARQGWSLWLQVRNKWVCSYLWIPSLSTSLWAANQMGLQDHAGKLSRSSATCFLSATIEPHWPDQVTAFLRRLQTQIHSGTGTPQQLIPDRNTAAQNITTVSPWFNNKGAIYASFSPPHYCNYMRNLAFLLYHPWIFSAHIVKAGTQQWGKLFA